MHGLHRLDIGSQCSLNKKLLFFDEPPLSSVVLRRYFMNSSKVTSFPFSSDLLVASTRKFLTMVLPTRLWKYLALAESPSNLLRYADKSLSNGCLTNTNLVYSARTACFSSSVRFDIFRKTPGEWASDAGIWRGSVPLVHWSVSNMRTRFQFVQATCKRESFFVFIDSFQFCGHWDQNGKGKQMRRFFYFLGCAEWWFMGGSTIGGPAHGVGGGFVLYETCVYDLLRGILN